MTVEKFAKDWLFNNGLWEDECDSILSSFKSENKVSGQIKWNDFIEGYPDVFKSAITRSLKIFALEWLKKNKPQHFAIFMLETQ